MTCGSIIINILFHTVSSFILFCNLHQINLSNSHFISCHEIGQLDKSCFYKESLGKMCFQAFFMTLSFQVIQYIHIDFHILLLRRPYQSSPPLYIVSGIQLPASAYITIRNAAVFWLCEKGYISEMGCFSVRLGLVVALRSPAADYI